MNTTSDVRADVPADVSTNVPADVSANIPADVKSGNRGKEAKPAAPSKIVHKYLPLGNGKHARVCTYKKKPYVNIRDYTNTSEGQLYPTKRGILLKPEEWKQLKKSVKEVDQELKLIV